MIFYMKQLNFWLSLAIAMAANSTSAQNVIKGAGTDDKFANTTVVFKDSATTDQAVLDQLNDSNLGIGDVVRITTPPPKQKVAAPIAVKKAAPVNAPTIYPPKPATNNTSGLLASTDNPALMLATINERPQPIQAANTPRPVRTTRTVVVPRITPSLVENDRETTQTITSESVSTNGKHLNTSKTLKTGKSGRTVKSVRKGGKKTAAHRTMARKYKARGKQRYDCYHF